MLNLTPSTLISRIITLIIAFSVHEFSHAFIADSFGDDTPRSYGRLTLNPAAHLDLMGTLMLLVAGFGWARPVPINPYALRRRSPAAVMWVSLAGPVSNLLLAIIAALPIRFGLVSGIYQAGGMFPTLSGFLLEFIVINLSLALFNLIPISPLDGEKIAEYLFPPAWSRFMDTIRPYGPIILLALIFVLPSFGINLFSMILSPVLNLGMRVLLGGL
jgi:Zn-dependent protease